VWFQYGFDDRLQNTSQLESQSQLQSQSQSQVQSQQFQQTTLSNNMGQKKYEEVNQSEFHKVPDIVLQKTEVKDFDNKDEIKYKTMDKNEVHVLPTLHVQEKPVIIEKEIEYEKPVEVKQTIIHQEKPIIVEQPIIKQTNEHYREATQHIQSNEKIVKEKVSEQDVGNLDEQAILNLRKDRIDSYNDTTPIVQYQKQNVQLDTDFRQKPTEVREKEVVYEQPVEIQRTQIEKIIPKVREEVTLEKEHIHQKLAPEVYQEETRQVFGNDKYFSQDTTNLNNGDTFVAQPPVAGEENRKQVM
jgi:molybdopterin converting factor small subunit